MATRIPPNRCPTPRVLPQDAQLAESDVIQAVVQQTSKPVVVVRLSGPHCWPVLLAASQSALRVLGLRGLQASNCHARGFLSACSRVYCTEVCRMDAGTITWHAQDGRPYLLSTKLLLRQPAVASICLVPLSSAAAHTEVDSAAALGAGLTVREAEIFPLVAQGMCNKQIADRLHLSSGTVRTHLNRIFKKLKVAGRVEAINVVRQYS